MMTTLHKGNGAGEIEGESLIFPGLKSILIPTTELLLQA